MDDDDDDTPMPDETVVVIPSPRAPPPARPRPPRDRGPPPPGPCFLCKYNNTQTARTLHAFITENAAIMTPEQLAEEAATTLARLHADCEGIDQAACLRHIAQHALHPAIRIATMMRSLLHLSDQMKLKLDRNEEGVENKDAETFLRIQSQILNVYRTQQDFNKLLFGQVQPSSSSSSSQPP